MNTNRRCFLKTSGLVLTYTLGAQILRVTPAEAQAQKLPLRQLSDTQAQTLQALAEALVPGAATAGISHYIDSQLNGAAQDSLLMIRYLGVPASHREFYTGGRDAIARQARARYRTAPAALDESRMVELIDDLAQGKLENWSGPPAGLFYFVVRADAADVVYGTEASFDRLKLPYLPHIKPPKPW